MFGRIGNNASGRCMGFAIDLAHNPRKQEFVQDIRPIAKSFRQISKALSIFGQLLKSWGLSVRRGSSGKYYSAATEHGVQDLVKFWRER
jgi:hypothetical protein